MGLKIWCQVGEFEFHFQNSYGEMCFWKIMLKVRCFKTTGEHRPFLSKFYVKLGSWGIIHTGENSPLEVSTKPLHLPPGSSAGFTPRARSASLRMGWGGVGRGIKSVLQFSLYIEHVYVYLYTCSKIVTNFVMGLKIWCQVGDFGFYFQNSYRDVCFLIFILKVRCFKHTGDHRQFLSNFDVNLSNLGMIHTANNRHFGTFKKCTFISFWKMKGDITKN